MKFIILNHIISLKLFFFSRVCFLSSLSYLMFILLNIRDVEMIFVARSSKSIDQFFFVLISRFLFYLRSNIFFFEYSLLINDYNDCNISI